MLIDGSFAIEWYNWIHKKKVAIFENSPSLNTWIDRKSWCYRRKIVEKCVFNERFVDSSTINHFYLFYDLLILLQWSGFKKQRSTFSINYTRKRMHGLYIFDTCCLVPPCDDSSGVSLEKSNKRSLVLDFSLFHVHCPLETCSLAYTFRLIFGSWFDGSIFGLESRVANTYSYLSCWS